METAFYHQLHFKKVVEFIWRLPDSNIEAIKKIKNLIQNRNVKKELDDLLKFKILLDNIQEIQSQKLTTNEQYTLIQEVKLVIEGTEYAKEKLERSLDKNENLSHFFRLAKDPIAVCAPLTTVAVESSFSKYVSLYSDKRNRFSDENIEKFIFVHYNNFL